MPNPNTTRDNGRSPAPGPGGGNHRVAGVFSRPDDVTRAVERLSAESVPADEIDVFAIDDEGKQTRRIAVDEESGTLKGAVIGAVAGAALGLVVMLLAMTDVFGSVFAGPFSDTELLNVLRVMGASAAMGVPIGAVVGMGHWQGKKKLVTRDFGQGAVMVIVESNELQDVARRVLRDAGADQVSG
jgi:hypothetical protein